MNVENTQKHFGAFFDKNSKILILGSFPSKSSLDAEFFYQNCTNRFWCILGRIFDVKGLHDDIERQKEFLKDKHIALWDIFKLCYKNPVNSTLDRDIVLDKSEKVDLNEILKQSQIQYIFTTIGKTGNLTKWGVKEWIQSYFPHKKIDDIFYPLYSTSARSPKKDSELLNDYKIIKEKLELNI